jgi:hypothetical protein
MDEKGPQGGQTRPEEVAAYIAVLAAEMVRLSRNHNLVALGYLLDLARMEALERSNGTPGGQSERIA